jgi:hypothetical protein
VKPRWETGTADRFEQRVEGRRELPAGLAVELGVFAVAAHGADEAAVSASAVRPPCCKSLSATLSSSSAWGGYRRGYSEGETAAREQVSTTSAAAGTATQVSFAALAPGRGLWPRGRGNLSRPVDK